MRQAFVAGAPRYSEAQIAAFEVLGIVPWIRRSTVPDPSAAEQGAEAVADALPGPLHTPVSTPMPTALSELGEWLAAQPLAGFARRGERRYETGPDAAPLLIVADVAPPGATLLPVQAREAGLLELMMRSIDLPPGSWSTSVLADTSRSAVPAGLAGSPLLAQRLDLRRALLWLVHRPGEAGVDDAHRFDVAGVPAFRVAHPGVMLTQPALKRQAWQTLKALRNLLAGA